jgi:hypothetical protein
VSDAEKKGAARVVITDGSPADIVISRSLHLPSEQPATRQLRSISRNDGR